MCNATSSEVPDFGHSIDPPASHTVGGCTLGHIVNEDDDRVERVGGRGTDSRHRMLEAGMALLAESGRSDLGRLLTTKAVAAKAGLHRQTFYLNWSSQSEYIEDFIQYVTDPELSPVSDRLARLAERLPELGDDPAGEVRERNEETFAVWSEDHVHVARMVLWSLHAQDETVADRMRELYRVNDENTAEAYRQIGEQWGLEPRPPFTHETIALLFNALRDGLLLHLTVDSSSIPPSFIGDVTLALSWAVTRRIGDPTDADTMDERFRRDVGTTRGPGQEADADVSGGAGDGPPVD